MKTERYYELLDRMKRDNISPIQALTVMGLLAASQKAALTEGRAYLKEALHSPSVGRTFPVADQGFREIYDLGRRRRDRQRAFGIVCGVVGCALRDMGNVPDVGRIGGHVPRPNSSGGRSPCPYPA